MSRLPLEQMIASLRPVLCGASNDGTMGAVVVVSLMAQTHPFGLGRPET